MRLTVGSVDFKEERNGAVSSITVAILLLTPGLTAAELPAYIALICLAAHSDEHSMHFSKRELAQLLAGQAARS